MPMLQQIYCKENNTCFSVRLEKRKIVKKMCGKIISLVVIFLFIGIVALFPIWLTSSIVNSANARTLAAAHMENMPITPKLVINPFAGLVPYLPGIFTVLIILELISLIVSFVLQCFYYRYYFYDLGPDEIVIKKGVVGRRGITIPYSKIQNVFVDQDWLDRLFGLYDVHMETAGLGSGYVSHIDGVNLANSEKLRELIMSKVKKQV